MKFSLKSEQHAPGCFRLECEYRHRPALEYNEANGLGSIEIYRKTNEVRASDEHNPLTTSPGAGWGVRFADVLEPCSPLAARRKTTTMCRGWCSRGAL